MKNRISITVDKDIDNRIWDLIKKRKYRSRSHFVEDAIYMLLEKEGGKK